MKRKTIKRILNRNKNYSLADYARKTSKVIGKVISKSNVRSSLINMKREGQITFSFTGNYVVGSSLYGRR